MAKAVTPGQAGMLAFFGRSVPDSSAKAHALITELMKDPVNAKRWIAERARRLLQKAPNLYRSKDNPQDSHGELFKAACALVHGFDLDQATAFPLLREYANRSDEPWSDQEVSYKLRSAAHSAHELPRGHLIGDDFVPRRRGAAGALKCEYVGKPPFADAEWKDDPTMCQWCAGTGHPYGDARYGFCECPALSGPRRGAGAGAAYHAAPAPSPSPRKLVDFDPKKLASLAAKWRDSVNVEWLANRSAADPFTIGARAYLDAMYRPGEKVLVFTVYRSQGQALWPADEIPTAGDDGVWYLAQPVNGESLPNPRTGKMSRRSMESVTGFRYLVLESDQADVRDWLGLIVQLPLRIEAVYTSGGKSVHALVRVDCASHRQWEDYVRGLMPTLNLLGMAGVDPKTLTSVRLTRLPGCMRAGKLQKLLFFMPGRSADDVRAIEELPLRRDVVAGWLQQSNEVLDGHAEPRRELTRALAYYAPCNASCRRALADIETLSATSVS